MADLKKEYTDIKNIRHQVEHFKASSDHNKEQIIQELFHVLTKTNKRVLA